MDNFNLPNMISKYINYKPMKANGANNSAGNSNNAASQGSNPSPANSPRPTPPSGSSGNMQMNNLENVDRSVYVKDLMKLPKNMNELFFMLQKNMNQMQFNRMFEQHLAAQKNLLSQTQAQILAQLQGLSTSEMQAMLKSQLSGQLQSSLKNLQLSANQMINLADIAALIQINGKDAVTKLILAMANASKQGITDLSQLKDTARLINASIALASQENSAQTLRTLMLLYLPWLPLHEGVGFDLEIESASEGAESESVLIITITTVNYGTVTATLILETQNSVHVNIECLEKFPKDELLLRLESEQKHYSMQSVISFETKSVKNDPQKSEQAAAKINMSHTNEISPYLLLMAHAIIRNTVELDAFCKD